MHWATPKTKDRMLPETSESVLKTGEESSSAEVASTLSAGSANSVHRRASEGGAALYYGGRRGEWGTENPNEVVNKFRNYEI